MRSLQTTGIESIGAGPGTGATDAVDEVVVPSLAAEVEDLEPAVVVPNRSRNAFRVGIL